MLRGRHAGIAAALAIVAVAAVTAGCGGGSKALAFDPVAAAATKTQAAGAARIRFSLAFNAPQLESKTLRISGSGATDGTNGELTFGLGSILAGLPSGTLPAATAAQLAHASTKEVFLKEDSDFVIYLRLGFLASKIPGGKQWLKLDLSKLGKSAGVDLSQLLSGSQFAPTDLLSMLKAEGAKIDNLGPATVDGTATTHYRVTVDVAKALEARGLTSPLLAGVVAEMPTVPEDVWIGKDGLVHRIKLSLSLQKNGKPLRMAMAMDLYDYGAHVTIAAPPASDVFDATQLAQQRLGSSFHF